MSQTNAGFNCNKVTSGSMVISENQFRSGEFEFKILPQFTDGVVTVFGIADDGFVPQDPFFQIVFDSGKHTNKTVNLILDGFEGYEPINTFIDVNEVNDDGDNTTFDDSFYNFKIKKTNDYL